jgi:hypothetical protein
MRSSTTMPPTSIRECANGSSSIPAGPSTSRRPRRPGSMPSKVSSPSSPTGASSAACSDPSRNSRPRNRSLRRGNQRRSQTLHMVGTPKPHPRRCQTREGKVRVDPLAPLLDERSEVALVGSTILRRQVAVFGATLRELPPGLHRSFDSFYRKLILLALDPGGAKRVLSQTEPVAEAAISLREFCRRYHEP